MSDEGDRLKDLLLEDYRYFAESMRRSEQSGEIRLSFFVGLITFCSTAVGAGYSGLAGKHFLSFPMMHAAASLVAISLLAVGVIILGRMLTRNENTDLAKEQLDLIRRTFREKFDKDNGLARYDLFPKSDGRKLGSLTDLIGVVNALLAAACVLFAVLALAQTLRVALPAALVAASIAIWSQRRYVASRTKTYGGRHKAHFHATHAGGVVYSAEGGRVRYLIVGPKDAEKKEWVLPKGHIEPGENPRQTATREVGEEAGVLAEIVGELPASEFRLRNSAKQVRTRFFVMEKVRDAPELRKDDRRIDWVSFDDAMKRLSFVESQTLVECANKMIRR